MAARVLLVTVLLLATGCVAHQEPEATRDAKSFQRLDCDPTNATTTNTHAPIAKGLRGGAIDAARALAREMNDSFSSETPTEESATFARWTTHRGQVQASREVREAPWFVDYSAPPSDAFSADNAARVATALGASAVEAYASNSASHGSFHQSLGEGRIMYVQGLGPEYGRWGSMSAGGLRDLQATPRPTQSPDAVATAIAFDRCTMDREGRTASAGYALVGEPHASLSAQGDALVWRVALSYSEPESSHCGMQRIVAVDAVTGAVVAQVPFMCD